MLEVAMFIVDTMSCIAFIVTAYYAFIANSRTAKINKNASKKDEKILQFYQQSISEKQRDRRIDDMVAYTQNLLTQWCKKTLSSNKILKQFNEGKQFSIKDFNFRTQEISTDDVYFDDIDITFWNCVMTITDPLNERNKEDKNKLFIDYVFEKIERLRLQNYKFDIVMRLLLSNITDFTGPNNLQGQLFQNFRNTKDIYQVSYNINEIIKCLYTNKLTRDNLFDILKQRIPADREKYDNKLKTILGINNN